MKTEIAPSYSRHAFRFAATVGATSTRLLLGCFCAGALAAAGCGNAHEVPTGPSGMAPVTSSVVTATSARERPFKGSLELSEIERGEFPNFTVDSTGGGQASHVGRYTIVAETQLDISRAEDLQVIISVGSFTLTAANGDQLFGRLNGVGTLVSGGVSIVDNGVITGGTGRFADASGSFTIERLLLDATHTSTGSFDGTITY